MCDMLCLIQKLSRFFFFTCNPLDTEYEACVVKYSCEMWSSDAIGQFIAQDEYC